MIVKSFNCRYTQLQTSRKEYERINLMVEEKVQEAQLYQKELNSLKEEKENKKKSIQQNELEIRKLLHKKDKSERDAKESAKQLLTLERENPWISKEKHSFGACNSDFDFASKDMSSCSQRLNEVKEEQVIEIDSSRLIFF